MIVYFPAKLAYSLLNMIKEESMDRDKEWEDVEMAIDQRELKNAQQTKKDARSSLIKNITKEAISRNEDALRRLSKS
jgi:hypothetical protein